MTGRNAYGGGIDSSIVAPVVGLKKVWRLDNKGPPPVVVPAAVEGNGDDDRGAAFSMDDDNDPLSG